VDALGEQVELLDAVDDDNHLPVEHVALRRQRQGLFDDVGEVAVHRLAVAALHLHLVTVAEHDRAKPVPLGLVAPVVAGGQLARALGQLRLHRW
jgi:hypothetical protein